ncbi:MAG: hypothetical protein Q8N98_02200, partial [bacterium]|nr:hypothetical protein [bacterium]
HMANDHEKRKLAAKFFRVNVLPHDQEAGGMEIGSASPRPQDQREITFKDLEDLLTLFADTNPRISVSNVLHQYNACRQVVLKAVLQKFQAGEKSSNVV